MKNFLSVFCLITFLSLGGFAQDSDTSSQLGKTITIADIEQLPKADSAEKLDIKKPTTDMEKTNELDLTNPLNEKIKKPAFPQGAVSDYNKNEFYVGYSYQSVDSFDRESFNGANISYVRNVTKYIGIKGDVSAAFRNDSFTFSDINTTGGGEFGIGGGPFTLDVESKSQLYNFLGGVQFKNNETEKKFKPFAYALAGAAHQRITSDTTCSGDCTGVIIGEITFSETSFAAAFGGGLDIKINDSVDFRLIKFDYNPIFNDGDTSNNFRVGIGFVFK